MFENYFKNLISLEEEETVDSLIRHHWFTFAGAFIKIIVPPIILFVFIYMYGFIKFLSLFESVIFSWIFLILFLIWITYSFYNWFIWYFDVTILTNRRAIVVEQKKLFEKSISETTYDKIQDITTNIAGPSQTFLGYGSVILQTAGELANLTLKEVANPQKIQQKILHIKNTQNPEETAKPENSA